MTEREFVYLEPGDVSILVAHGHLSEEQIQALLKRSLPAFAAQLRDIRVVAGDQVRLVYELNVR